MLRVVPGMPMDGRGEHLLAEALADGGGASHLHVVRTRARERQLHECERAIAGGRFGHTVVRLSDLVRRVAQRRTHVRAAVGDVERALLLDEIARTEARTPLEGVAGLATWLGRFFSVLKQGDVFSVEHALRKFRSLDRDDPGTAEALRLFGLYQSRLVELRLYDEDGLYLEVARDLGTPELPFDRLLPVRRRLVVEGFYQTNVVERAIFEKLFAAFDETSWLVDLPPGTPMNAFGVGVLADQELKGLHLQGDLSWLAGCGAWTGGARAEESATGGPLDWIWSPEIGQRTQLVVASNERVEARFLAERAAALVRSDPEASVVIAYPSDRAAAALVQEACADVGLALEVSAWRTLAECGPARAFRSLLSLSERDYPRERVVAALRGSTGGVQLGGARLVAARVDRVSRKAGVIAGAAEWQRKLGRLAAQCARRRDHATHQSDEAERDRLDRDCAEAEEVRAGIVALIDLIPRPEGRSSVGAFVARARDLLDLFGFLQEEHVPPGVLAPEEIEAFATAARTRDALASVLDTYERSTALVRERDRAWTDHVEALGALIEATIVPFSPPMQRGAMLVGMRELRGLVTDHLLVGGLTEDAFPGASDPVPILDEADAALAGARTPDDRRREAEHLLVQALRSPRKSLVLSCPKQRDDADVLPALALEIIRARHGGSEIRADDELRERPMLGRMTLARQTAAMLADDASSVAEITATFGRLAGAGADASLSWHRVAAERERSDRTRLGRFEGMLEEAARRLLVDGSPRLTMSASRFEDYVKCPLYYFFKRTLKLAVPEEAERDVTAKDRGSILHRILYRFHASVAPEAPRDEKERALESLAEDELEDLRNDGLFAEIYRDSLTRDLREAGPSTRPGMLRLYLDHEEGRRDLFRPGFCEARFGSSPKGAAFESVLSDEPIFLFDVESGDRRIEVVLTGSIDRVDLKDEGGELLALVLDYKTGSIEGKRKETRSGLLFQLPLYSHVLPRLIADRVGGRRVDVVGAAYYQVKSATELGIKEPIVEKRNLHLILPGSRLRSVLPDYRFPSFIAACVDRAREVVRATLAGRFHPTAIDSESNHCGICDFRSVCRGKNEATRLGRMAEARLFRQVDDLVGNGGEEESS